MISNNILFFVLFTTQFEQIISKPTKQTENINSHVEPNQSTKKNFFIIARIYKSTENKLPLHGKDNVDKKHNSTNETGEKTNEPKPEDKHDGKTSE